MKNKYQYNALFNTHTISGIVISIALYIIFFAGAFALFKDEITQWESGVYEQPLDIQDVDFDQILTQLDDSFDLKSRDIQINFNHHSADMYAQLMEAKDSTASTLAKTFKYVAINKQTGETATYEEKYSLGEFLFRLHFFAQLPYIGVYLAGFVSLFFLFAVITGIIIHWKHIIPDFFAFNPKTVLKRVWKDAHTTLGVIGLPFQLVYAITGAYFGLSILVLLPANILYNSDQDKLMKDLRPEREVIEWIGETNQETTSINTFIALKEIRDLNLDLQRITIKNYKGKNQSYILAGELPDKEKFLSTARISMDANSGNVKIDKNPNDGLYSDDIQVLSGRLHFASFGGILVKVLYFILAFITCFVIITGVLIWIESRNKKNMSLAQRLYTAKVGHIYLATCLTLFPVTALSFLIIKWLPESLMTSRMTILYTSFFLSWFVFILYFRFKRDNYLTNKLSLLLGAGFGILIPISNGVVSGNWVWNTVNNNQLNIAIVDIIWICLSVTAFWVYLQVKPEIKEKSTFYKLPPDYKAYKDHLHQFESNQNLNKNQPNSNQIPMRTKIVILWMFLAIGWIIHHIYGLFNIYYNETLIMEGATGEAPTIHHIYRILFEGVCLLFGLFTIEVSKLWFRKISLFWACLAGLYNVYHCITAIIYEPSNISEIYMLVLMCVASVFLFKSVKEWCKVPEI